MSIKTKAIAICDICGFTQEARPVGSQYNETIYDIPAGWEKSPHNEKVHMCPECARKLKVMYRGVR